MKNFGLYCIKLYWKYTPAEKRKVCIFHSSCSRHVYATIENEGLIKGILAYLRRRHECNKKFTLSNTTEGVILLCSNGRSYHQDDINPLIVREFLIDKINQDIIQD